MKIKLFTFCRSFVFKPNSAFFLNSDPNVRNANRRITTYIVLRLNLIKKSCRESLKNTKISFF
ncbi:hypothetical protein LEP1GSC193_2091 [Leptospira alstonii serovar Pingchang str. 80-412]|uniref:Uncharacterized protein n=2 Tax=Leptospira alstonii TaxID=28452 RepID=M6CWP5_9LEPT|nr:hypothetical protein LEP1GSC194_0506 [Leptospira alstonii serovar Sichuan str. 79601]EQA79740.1 hypothetical protein LEP1GSC193_2091 [Leptospira alstonii serovar Pingchang str. 80-412]